MLEIVSQSELPFQLTTLRDHCRVTDRNQDPALQRAMDSAALMVERWTNCFLRTTTVDAHFRGEPGPYRFEYGPIQSVTSVTDATNSTTVSTNSYELDKTAGWPQLRSINATAWLSRNAYTVRFVAGYTSVPKPLETCVFSLAATLFENRESMTPSQMHQLSVSMGSILMNYRMGSM